MTMKTQTFETIKGTLLAIKISDEFKDRKIVITKAGYPDIELIALGDTNPEYIGLLPPGDWQPLGLLKDISEEQAISVVDEDEVSDIEHNKYAVIYINYLNQDEAFENALESLTSLLETEIKLSNPLGKKPIRSIPFMGAGHYTQNDLDAIDQYQDYLKKWHSAESLVWKNPFLIFKNK